MPTNIQNIAIAIVVSLIVGFGSGYYTKSQFVKADQLDAVAEAQHQTATGIQQSLSTSLAVEAKVAASTQSNTAVRAVVAQHLKETTRENENTCSAYLDNWTVSMLNSARAGTTFDPTAFSNAQGKAASGVTNAEFIDNDLEVVGLYQELAARHDALVDYINALIQKQAK